MSIANSKQNERRSEQNQGCLGREEADQQVAGRKDEKRPCYSIEMVHQQGSAKCSHTRGNRKVSRSRYERFTEIN